QFCEKYRRWARVTKATMRISHNPGDAMQVDWAGDPLYITDPTTGEMELAYKVLPEQIVQKMCGYKTATKTSKTLCKSQNMWNLWTNCVLSVRFFTRNQGRQVEWE
ncbi:MAG: hypothetical protein J6P58_09150, partial [Oscillospiraceae bacterium]|nr:hypothetical protein [Oscillospiraceae bacterium]